MSVINIYFLCNIHFTQAKCHRLMTHISTISAYSVTIVILNDINVKLPEIADFHCCAFIKDKRYCVIVRKQLTFKGIILGGHT